MTQSKKILINATNLHEGGGVQVATSFLKDLVSLNLDKNLEFSAFVSVEVDCNIEEKSVYKNFFSEYRIVEAKEIGLLNSHKLNCYDVVFTVFGPFFLPFYRKKHISGFAQPWVIHPVEDVLYQFKFYKRFLLKFKYLLASYVFTKADLLIVESDHIRKLLMTKGYKNRIEVVENAISTIFFDKREWQPIPEYFFASKKINIGVLSGSYPHKNLDFVIRLAQRLELIHPNRFNFVFTLKPQKYDELLKGRQISSVCNIGVISLRQCPIFYNNIQGVILPSLLECFSITPFEAMLMKKIIFLSDRSFFREVCLNHAVYFDPLSVNNAISMLENFFLKEGGLSIEEHLKSAHNFVVSKRTSDSKAKSYIRLISSL